MSISIDITHITKSSLGPSMILKAIKETGDQKAWELLLDPQPEGSGCHPAAFPTFAAALGLQALEQLVPCRVDGLEGTFWIMRLESLVEYPTKTSLGASGTASSRMLRECSGKGGGTS